MSAILSADDLNDFISPGVACIKPIETIPAESKDGASNPYEVTTEDKVTAANPPPAQLSLTDCLACSGCVTSAEAMLVSLQSHTEVLNTLDAHPELAPPAATERHTNGAAKTGVATNSATAHHHHHHHGVNGVANGTAGGESKIFVASVSPQARASLAATFGVSEREAGHMVERLLSGPDGVRRGGAHGSGFAWVIDTNTVREAALVLAADEVSSALSSSGASSPATTTTTTTTTPGQEGAASTMPRKPILTSACPGWICYAEKTHPYVLPHLSRMKSPQALAGTLVKSVLWRRFGVAPERVWHLAVMPCFDKKLEASRSELTSAAWMPASSSSSSKNEPVRDVDCVITARELLSLAQSRGVDFAAIPRTPLPLKQRVPFPDPELDAFLFPSRRQTPTPNTTRQRKQNTTTTPPPSDPFAVGTSGGYLYHIMQTLAARHHANSAPPPSLHVERGRNADVVEYVLRDAATGAVVVKAARFYGFRNIQNLVRRLKPARASRMPGAARRRGVPPGGAGGAGGGDGEYAYVEVMACPGGCTNGGGQIKAGEVAELRGEGEGVATDEGVVVDGGEVKLQQQQQQQRKPGPQEQKEWLRRVDEAYFSASSSSSASEDESGEDEDVDMDAAERVMESDVGGDAMDVDSAPPSSKTDGDAGKVGADGEEEDVVVDGVSRRKVHAFLRHWSDVTGVDVAGLTQTSYRKVESDVGKAKKASDVERVAGLASSIGGGW
ncbi:cytosolic fe-s cluster assembly factor nar1 [Diplodia corticola]|uniref:Nuclear architecture-related protein 1 n=1 Tax=Diplodia corticola TaxID=236234 RepID=A0A1J9SAT0_9PEZI|nr:cytosolic fe-s cluster assembly factor nar1 [Diplodia corticola]OJD37599.1 cytosolic fe-s cluster assembly factor nar1 [Diplodia corticola]